MLARPGFVALGRTSMYIGFFRGTFRALGLGTAWRAQVITVAAHGVARAGYQGPVGATGQHAEIILRGSWNDDFARTEAMSWTPLLRVVSECLPQRRQRAGGGCENGRQTRR